MDHARVVLDTDFINGITEYQDGDPADLFRRVFRELGREPVVHPFVAERELIYNTVAQKLMKEGALCVIPLKNIIDPNSEEEQTLYRNNFEDMYTQITCETLCAETDIFGRNAKKSFGEIHSVLLAAELGIPLLYSNDYGAKTAARYYAKGRLTVQNAEEVAELLQDSQLIEAKERKFIRNVYKRARRLAQST